MNTTELIEIARECAEKYSVYGITNAFIFIEFDDAGLHEFIQRIEQPHLQRIAELENALRYIKEWTDRYTSPGHPISTVAGRVLSGESK